MIAFTLPLFSIFYTHHAMHTIYLDDRRHSKHVFVVTIEHLHSYCPIVVIVFAFAVVAFVTVVVSH